MVRMEIDSGRCLDLKKLLNSRWEMPKFAAIAMVAVALEMFAAAAASEEEEEVVVAVAEEEEEEVVVVVEAKEEEEEEVADDAVAFVKAGVVAEFDEAGAEVAAEIAKLKMEETAKMY